MKTSFVQLAILFFGTFGLGGFALGLKRYYTSGAVEYGIIALAGVALFAVCFLWKKILERRIR